MKPDFDLTDPRFIALQTELNARAVVAHQAAASLDHSVQTIYAFHEGLSGPKQIGSCVVFNIDDEFFLLSAAHVYEPIGPYVVLVGCGDKLHPLTGDRFSTKQGPSGTHADDKVDAAVLHITCAVPQELRECALTIDHLDASPAVVFPEFYVAAGYRASRATSSKNRLESPLDLFPSIEHFQAEYDRLNIDRTKYVAIAYDKQVLIDGRWQLAPSKLQGMSGGAIFRILGLRPDPRVPTPAHAPARLSAIIIERSNPRRKNDPLAIVGVRVGFHLGLIQTYRPGLLRDAA
jgi:hypothetical protein